MNQKKTSENILPEWSHKIDADDIGAAPLRTTISASPQERKDLARRLRVDSVDSLEAQLVLKRDPKNMIVHVAGDLHAKVTQSCVVTLEPMEQKIETSVDGWYADPDAVVSLTKARRDRQSRGTDSEFPVLEEKDDPEAIVNGEIDLGELVTQYLALAIDPYPRKEGADSGLEQADESGAKPPKIRQNPFAALKNWKKSESQES